MQELSILMIVILVLIALGTKYLSWSLVEILARWVRPLLTTWPGSPMNTLSSGALFGFFQQSAISTQLVAFTLTNSGSFSSMQSIQFALGALVGTLFLPWLLLFFPTGPFVLLLLIGGLPALFAVSRRMVNWGQLCFGLGLIALSFFLGHQIFIDHEIFSGGVFLESFNQSILGTAAVSGTEIFFSFWLAMVVVFFTQSNVVLVLFLLALAVSGMVHPDLVLCTFIGGRIGGFISLLPNWRSLGYGSRRALVFQFLSHAIVIAIILCFWQTITVASVEWLAQWNFASLQSLYIVSVFSFIVLSQLFIGIALGLIYAQLGPLMVSKPRCKQPQKLSLVGHVNQYSGVIGVEIARQELRKLAAMVQTTLLMTQEVVVADEASESRQRVIKYEKITDNIKREIIAFLNTISQLPLNREVADEIHAIQRMAGELESIADKCCAIVHLSEELGSTESASTEFGSTELGSAMSPLKEEVDRFFTEISRHYENVFGVLTELRPDVLTNSAVLEYRINELQSVFTQAITEKDKSGETMILAEILFRLRQVRSHTENLLQLNS